MFYVLQIAVVCSTGMFSSEPITESSPAISRLPRHFICGAPPPSVYVATTPSRTSGYYYKIKGIQEAKPQRRAASARAKKCLAAARGQEG